MIGNLLNLLRQRQPRRYEGRHRAVAPQQRKPESSDTSATVN
ncbi:MAG: hypothetical protein ACRDTU_14110 [Micromonosporaceae bacterium]